MSCIEDILDIQVTDNSLLKPFEFRSVPLFMLIFLIVFFSLRGRVYKYRSYFKSPAYPIIM